MLVPRAVLLRCKDTPLRNPQLDDMPVIVPPTTSKKAGKPTFLFGNYKSYYGYRTEEGIYRCCYIALTSQGAMATVKILG